MMLSVIMVKTMPYLRQERSRVAGLRKEQPIGLPPLIHTMRDKQTFLSANAMKIQMGYKQVIFLIIVACGVLTELMIQVIEHFMRTDLADDPAMLKLEVVKQRFEAVRAYLV